MSQHHYLVTGAAHGLGKAVAAHLASHGAVVFACDVDRAAMNNMPENIIPMKLDVTDNGSISRAARAVAKATDGLDGLVNVAGIFRAGTMVEIPEEDFSQILNVNVLGMYRVTKAFFDLLYARKGRIVNISSETARFSSAFNGAYSTSKFAVEAYTHALRRELLLLGMNAISIQPGPIKTPLLQRNKDIFLKAAAASRYFKPYLLKIAELVPHEEKKAVNPDLVAQTVYRALTVSRPKIRYRINNDRGRAFLAGLPDSLADTLLTAALKKIIS